MSMLDIIDGLKRKVAHGALNIVSSKWVLHTVEGLTRFGAKQRFRRANSHSVKTPDVSDKA